MDRNRESRRSSVVGSNGFNRRRHRTNSVRDSPGEDGGLELQESVLLRERVKKDRDQERERERPERDLRERSNRSKRKRAEILQSNRDDTGVDETSDESLKDDEDDENEENVPSGAGCVRILSPAVGCGSNHQNHLGNHHHHHIHSNSFSQPQQHNNNITSNIVSNRSHHLHHRKTFPSSSSAKILRAPPVWKSGDEMISVSVPRKARSVSMKRSHEWISSASNNSSAGVSGGADQNPSQPSSTPERPTHVSARADLPVLSPPSPSSNTSIRRKLKPSAINTAGPKLKSSPKVSASPSPPKPSSSNSEEVEIEIAEVLYGLMTQAQGPYSSKKEESREVHGLSMDAKSRNSSPISNSTPHNNDLIAGPNSGILSAVPPKRKRPRQVPENSIMAAQTKPETNQTPKSQIPSPNVEKMSGSAGEDVPEAMDEGNLVISQGHVAELSLYAADKFKKTRDVAEKKDVSSSKEDESSAVRSQNTSNRDLPSVAAASSAMDALPVSDSGIKKEENLELALMDKAKVACESGNGNVCSINVATEERKSEESESDEVIPNKGLDIDLRLDLEKPGREISSSSVSAKENKSQVQTQKQSRAQGHSTSFLPLPLPMASWPGGLPPIGYMAPLQGVVSMDGSSVAPAHIQPILSQPRRNRCATHFHIARNIHSLQQFTKMNAFWPSPAGSPASLLPWSLNVGLHADLSIASRGIGSRWGKEQPLAGAPDRVGKDKSCQPANSSESAQRKQQQPPLIQQALPHVPPSNLLGPAFIFPLNQQQAAASHPAARKSPTTTPSPNAATASTTPTPISFSYANMMPPNETAQYLAILQNSGYPFPIPNVPAPSTYRGPFGQGMPMFNGPFYSSQVIHHQQLPQQSQHQLPAQLKSGAVTVSSNQNEKSLHQQQGLKSGVEPMPPPHSFSMSFGPTNRTPAGPGMDRVPTAQNPAVFQNFPEAPRQGAEMAVVAKAAQKSIQISEGKSVNADDSSKENERKSFAFSRSTDMVDQPGASSSSLSMNVGPGSASSSRPVTMAVKVPNTHEPAQLHQLQMLQLKQQQQQQMAATNAVNRAVASNGSIYSDHLTSSATAGPKFQSTISPFPSNLIQSNSPSLSPSQSPQWKSSTRTPATLAQGPSSLGPSGIFLHKNVSQQHSRTQISFGGNLKQSMTSQGQQVAPSTSNQVGSPTSGSPRTTSSASTNNKTGQVSSFSTQQPKNSPSIPTQKSLGNPQGAKNQMQKQSQSPLFFSSSYIQSQAQHSMRASSSAAASSSGYFTTQTFQGLVQQQRGSGGAPLTPSSGVPSLSTPASLSNDLATAIPSATCSSAKGGGSHPHAMMHGSSFGAQSSGMLLPAGFSYVHPLPAGVQAKPDQKQPSGNENLHPWQPEKKG